MRVHFLSADAAGRIDGAVQSMLLSGFSDVSASADDCDVIVIPITKLPDFKFNPALRYIKRPWCLLDYSELEWNYFDLGNPTLLFGKNHQDCKWLDNEWLTFGDFVRDHQPALYLKRELLADDVSDTVKPCDWPCVLDIPPLQTEDEFNARRIEVCHGWGFSHPSRPRLHAEIFKAMTTHNIGVISELHHMDGYFKSPSPRTWVSVFSPWYARKPMQDILRLQMQSKLSVSLPGAGQKCFRHSEAPVGSSMALPFDELAWSYDWIDTLNCIRLEPDHHFDDLHSAPQCLNLYDIYVRSQETVRLYQTRNYVRDYLEKLIEAKL